VERYLDCFAVLIQLPTLRCRFVTGSTVAPTPLLFAHVEYVIAVREVATARDRANSSKNDRTMNNTKNQRVIVISGASAGQGRATAQGFARNEGAPIALIARGQDVLEGAQRDVESLGGKALILQADVADADAVEAAARVETELGRCQP
jgi:short chain dehydrogenase